MRPIAIAFKDRETNPFTNRTTAEIMVIHLCLNCNSIKTNRIAGDDTTSTILSIYREGLTLDTSLMIRIRANNIDMATQKDKDVITLALFGEV